MRPKNGTRGFWGWSFRVRGQGFGVGSTRLGLYNVALSVQDFMRRVSCSVFRCSSFVFRVSRFGVRVLCFVFRVSCFGYRASSHESTEWASQTIPSKVDVRLPGKGNSNTHDTRSVHLIITMIKRTQTSRLSIKNFLSLTTMNFLQCRPCKIRA